MKTERLLTQHKQSIYEKGIDERGIKYVKDIQGHKEYYESKLEMYVCGCGNMRNLTIQERLDRNLKAETKSGFEIQIIDINAIPNRKGRY
jgi:hypothetical protein